MSRKNGVSVFLLALLCVGAYSQGLPVEHPETSRDTLASAGAGDSAGALDSESARMYQSAVSTMRRDAPGQSSALDTSANARRMKIAGEEIAAPPMPKRMDSITIAAQGDQPVNKPHSNQRPQVKKSSILIAVGSCALIGCGIAAYVLKNSKNDDVIAQNNRIPPPPNPPVNLRRGP
jgi:hypothetical protein